MTKTFDTVRGFSSASVTEKLFEAIKAEMGESVMLNGMLLASEITDEYETYDGISSVIWPIDLSQDYTKIFNRLNKYHFWPGTFFRCIGPHGSEYFLLSKHRHEKYDTEYVFTRMKGYAMGVDNLKKDLS